MRPQQQDYINYFDRYIQLIPESDVISALKNNHQSTLSFIENIPAEKAEHAYAENKWTVKQVLNHIIDTERILCYRALRFSRGDGQLVASFDENKYAANARLTDSSLALLADEFNSVRSSTRLFYSQLSEKEWMLKGKLSSGEVNVLSLGYFIGGHTQHHINIIKERYL